jgi:hypothetical protein
VRNSAPLRSSLFAVKIRPKLDNETNKTKISSQNDLILLSLLLLLLECDLLVVASTVIITTV